MKAAVFHKPKDLHVETALDPKIEQERNGISKVATAIGGSDLQICIRSEQ